MLSAVDLAFLTDVCPSAAEVEEVIGTAVAAEMFTRGYQGPTGGEVLGALVVAVHAEARSRRCGR